MGHQRCKALLSEPGHHRKPEVQASSMVARGSCTPSTFPRLLLQDGSHEGLLFRKTCAPMLQGSGQRTVTSSLQRATIPSKFPFDDDNHEHVPPESSFACIERHATK